MGGWWLTWVVNIRVVGLTPAAPFAYSPTLPETRSLRKDMDGLYLYCELLIVITSPNHLTFDLVDVCRSLPRSLAPAAVPASFSSSRSQVQRSVQLTTNQNTRQTVRREKATF